MSKRPDLLVTVLISLSLVTYHASVAQAQLHSKGVEVSLRAKWSPTPLIHEAAEFLADEDAAIFFRFARSWNDSDPPQQCWAQIVAKAAPFLSPSMLDIFRMSLAIRQYSPRLEAFRQQAISYKAIHNLPPATCCFAVVDGRAFADVEELKAAVVRPSSEVVLYAPIGSTCGAKFDEALGQVVSSGEYLWRPVSCEEESGTSTSLHHCANFGQGKDETEKLSLYGYGVELAIKNVEYNARDEESAILKSKNDSENDSEAESTDQQLLGNVAGFDFDRLAARKPELRQELLTFRDSLVSRAESGRESTPLKIWDLKDLGLQAVQRVTKAADPLHLLTELSQNFPSLVENLSKGKVDAELRRAAQAASETFPSGTNFLIVNGVPMLLNRFNLYDFVQLLRQEVDLLDDLTDSLTFEAKSEANPSKAAAALRSSAVTTQPSPRLDLLVDKSEKEEQKGADSSIVWINDVEKDQEYAGMPTTLSALLRPMFPGQVPMVRRNLFTALIAVDVASAAGDATMSLLREALAQRWPIRFGIIPLASPSPLSMHNQSLLRVLHDKYVAAFIAMAELKSGRAAVEFAATANYSRLSAMEETMRALDEARKSFVSVYKSDRSRSKTQHTSSALDSGLHSKLLSSIKSADEAFERAEEIASRTQSAARTKLQRAGLGGPTYTSGPLVIFNGLVIPSQSLSPRDAILSSWQAEVQKLQFAVYKGKISDAATATSETASKKHSLYSQVLSLHQGNVVRRYNPRVLGEQGAFATANSGDSGVQRALIRQGNGQKGPALNISSLASLPVTYFYAGMNDANDAVEDHSDDAGAAMPSMITHWVVLPIDLICSPQQIETKDSVIGLELAAAALQHIVSSGDSSEARVGIIIDSRRTRGASGGNGKQEDEEMKIHDPNCQMSNDTLRWESLVTAIAGGGKAFLEEAAISTTDVIDTFAQLAEQLVKGNPESSLSGLPIELSLVASKIRAEKVAEIQAAHAALLSSPALDVAIGRPAVITNGRILYARERGDIVIEDFELLELYARRAQYVGPNLSKLLLVPSNVSRVIPETVAMVVSSLLAEATPADGVMNAAELVEAADRHIAADSPKKSTGNWLSFSTSSDIEDRTKPQRPKVHIRAVLDPLSKATQQIAPVLSSVRSSLNVDIQVLLVPGTGYTDLPLKSYYRYVVPQLRPLITAGTSTHNAVDQSTAMATFRSLPPTKTLTLGLDIPENWVVEPVSAAHDLDNLHLEELPPGEHVAKAIFELEALLVTGNCIDESAVTSGRETGSGIHPRGVQLTLSPGMMMPTDSALSSSSSSPVVDTLVMSNLGYFQLKAAHPGRWKLRLAEGRSSDLYTIRGDGDDGQYIEEMEIPVASFTSKNVLLLLHKDPGRVNEDVLDEIANESSKVTRTSISHRDEDETIHVFTVASGHMYERLQKIMILSAVKRSSRKLKFWFIKNYMSPAMKQFVPHMARLYGFDYEFVTYKWPSWLHAQTEKQRIIWAYKILFLDVLFPLGLKKVVFCDSDQVIRADLAELWDMDLGGAPYAYTPFCDTNKEMEGFRFWKQGFWQSHLQGRPYHISALYVVDLERFRATAAGDRLRVIYDILSRDPESLSNLDQDLPNYAQSEVPIKSLPQEWLWCETWCGNASRPAAKTIDLCNNPLTKEPKLQSARRIIAEWPDLDREAQELTARVDLLLDGKLSEDKVNASRFMTVLEPMREGSVRTIGDDHENGSREVSAANDDGDGDGDGDGRKDQLEEVEVVSHDEL